MATRVIQTTLAPRAEKEPRETGKEERRRRRRKKGLQGRIPMDVTNKRRAQTCHCISIRLTRKTA
eukprot:4186050-Amphidinium_carterae.1